MWYWWWGGIDRSYGCTVFWVYKKTELWNVNTGQKTSYKKYERTSWTSFTWNAWAQECLRFQALFFVFVLLLAFVFFFPHHGITYLHKYTEVFQRRNPNLHATVNLRFTGTLMSTNSKDSFYSVIDDSVSWEEMCVEHVRPHASIESILVSVFCLSALS